MPVEGLPSLGIYPQETASSRSSVAAQGILRDLFEFKSRLQPAELGPCVCVYLVVEDEPLILDIIAETLEGAGYDVMRASTGPQAVGLIAAGKTEFSALFSDFHLPGGLTGLDVAAVMRERFPGLPVILATGRPDVLEEPARPPRATSCCKSRMGRRRCCGSSAGWSRRITGSRRARSQNDFSSRSI